jgi:hypothetical protein
MLLRDISHWIGIVIPAKINRGLRGKAMTNSSEREVVPASRNGINAVISSKNLVVISLKRLDHFSIIQILPMYGGAYALEHSQLCPIWLCDAV